MEVPSIIRVAAETGSMSLVEPPRASVLARVCPWVQALVAAPQRQIQTPVPWIQDWTGSASSFSGALIVTLAGPGHPVTGVRPPLITVGVAPHAEAGRSLWPVLTRSEIFGARVSENARHPREPWAVTLGWPALEHPDLASAGELAAAVAWCWTSRGALRPANGKATSEA